MDRGGLSPVSLMLKALYYWRPLSFSTEMSLFT